MYVKTQLNIKFIEIRSLDFAVEQPKICVTRYFPKIVKSCSRHPKTCKSYRNQKSKMLAIRMLCIKERKNFINSIFPFPKTLKLFELISENTV